MLIDVATAGEPFCGTSSVKASERKRFRVNALTLLGASLISGLPAMFVAEGPFPSHTAWVWLNVPFWAVIAYEIFWFGVVKGAEYICNEVSNEDSVSELRMVERITGKCAG